MAKKKKITHLTPKFKQSIAVPVPWAIENHRKKSTQTHRQHKRYQELPWKAMFQSLTFHWYKIHWRKIISSWRIKIIKELIYLESEQRYLQSYKLIIPRKQWQIWQRLKMLTLLDIYILSKTMTLVLQVKWQYDIKISIIEEAL